MTAGRGARAAESFAVLAAGALHSLPFVRTEAWWLQIACVAALVWRLDGTPARRAAWLGWCFGFAWLASGVWWLFVSMHRYGGLPAPLAASAVAALSGALSLYLAIAAGLYARGRRGAAGRDALLFGLLWLAAELARGLLFTGFPWIASGYAHVDGPLAALAPWVGVYGIGAVGAAIGAALAGLARPRRGRAAIGLLAFATLVAAAHLGPREFSRPAGQLDVSLLQTNVPQNQKFDFDKLPEQLGALAQALQQARGALVVAPETAMPLLPSQLAQIDPHYWDAVKATYAVPGRALLIGLPLGDFEAGYTNSVAGLSSAPSYYRYDKHHLVPFGEFIPRGFRWFTEMMNIPLGDFNRGPVAPPSFGFAGQRIAPNICYEDLFGEELARRFADPAQAPTVFANVSNIGWFGRTIAVDQHLQISRMRTLEFQRPMLRSTNTGATAIIDHRARVTAWLEPHTHGVLDGRFEGREGRTPYARWAAHFGLWPLVALAVAGVLWAVAKVGGARRGPAMPT